VEAFHVRAVTLYFAALLAVSFALRLSDGAGLAQAARGSAVLGALFAFATGMLLLLARASARTTLYTITTRRVVMRVGIVLTLSFNLPLKRLVNADLRMGARGGPGDIALRIAAPDRIAIFHLWPHARPWRIRSPEPMLRAVPDAAAVAECLRAAWSAATGSATSTSPVAAPVAPQAAPPRNPAIA
jgi:hypothetical protein